MPVIYPGRARDGFACSRADDGAVASTDERYPFEDVKCLAVGVDVPVGSRSGCEMDDGCAVAGAVDVRQGEHGRDQ